jgi:integrase
MKSIEPSACKNNIPYYSFICDEAAIALKLYLRERIEKNCSITDNEPLFASDFKMISKEDRKNKILCPRQLQDIVKIPAEKVIPVNGHFVSPRSLRKTFDSVLRAENVEGTHMDHKVQEFLVGHLLPGSQDHYFDRDKVEELRIEYSKLSFGRPSVGNKFKLLKQAIARAFQGTGLDADEVLKEYIEMKGRQ